MSDVTYPLALDIPLVISPQAGHKLRIEKRNGKCIIDHEIDGVLVTVLQLPLDPYEEKLGLID